MEVRNEDPAYFDEYTFSADLTTPMLDIKSAVEHSNEYIKPFEKIRERAGNTLTLITSIAIKILYMCV